MIWTKQSRRTLCILVFFRWKGFQVSALPVPTTGRGYYEERKGRRRLGGRREPIPCKSTRGSIYIEDTQGGTEQHCRGIILSYKHVLLATLRAELLGLVGDVPGRKEERVTVFNFRALARTVAASLPSKGR